MFCVVFSIIVDYLLIECISYIHFFLLPNLYIVNLSLRPLQE